MPTLGGIEIDFSESFRSSERATDVTSDALVIACSDRRFQGGFREFLTGYLGLSHWDSIVVPGGPFVLVWPGMTDFGAQMAEFLMGLSRPPKVVLISHDGCVRYQRSYEERMDSPGFSLASQQKHDLRAATASLRESFPFAEVMAYFAARSEDGALLFEPV